MYNNIMAVGAYQDDTTNGGANAGNIHIYIYMIERKKK
jgi:hypothetical protein